MLENFSYEHLARTKSTNQLYERMGRSLDIVKATAPKETYFSIFLDIWGDIAIKTHGSMQMVEDFIEFIEVNKNDSQD